MTEGGVRVHRERDDPEQDDPNQNAISTYPVMMPVSQKPLPYGSRFAAMWPVMTAAIESSRSEKQPSETEDHRRDAQALAAWGG